MGQLKMTKSRAEELIAPLRKGTAEGVSVHWQARLVEALEYVIEAEPEIARLQQIEQAAREYVRVNNKAKYDLEDTHYVELAHRFMRLAALLEAKP